MNEPVRAWKPPVISSGERIERREVAKRLGLKKLENPLVNPPRRANAELSGLDADELTMRRRDWEGVFTRVGEDLKERERKLASLKDELNEADNDIEDANTREERDNAWRERRRLLIAIDAEERAKKLLDGLPEARLDILGTNPEEGKYRVRHHVSGTAPDGGEAHVLEVEKNVGGKRVHEYLIARPEAFGTKLSVRVDSLDPNVKDKMGNYIFKAVAGMVNSGLRDELRPPEIRDKAAIEAARKKAGKDFNIVPAWSLKKEITHISHGGHNGEIRFGIRAPGEEWVMPAMKLKRRKAGG